MLSFQCPFSLSILKTIISYCPSARVLSVPIPLAKSVSSPDAGNMERLFSAFGLSVADGSTNDPVTLLPPFGVFLSLSFVADPAPAEELPTS